MSRSPEEQQVLDLCSRATNLISNISTYLVEYLDSSKQTSGGFRVLAVNFLELCQTLWPLQSGLMAAAAKDQILPQEVLNELQKKLQLVIRDFKTVDLLLVKLLTYEQTRGFSRFVKGFGISSVETDMRTLSEAFVKHRDSLRMASLAFEWASGSSHPLQTASNAYNALARVLKLGDTAQLKKSTTPSVSEQGQLLAMPRIDVKDPPVAPMLREDSSTAASQSPLRLVSRVDRPIQLSLPTLPYKRSNSGLQPQSSQGSERYDPYQRPNQDEHPARSSPTSDFLSPAELSLKHCSDTAAATNPSQTSLESFLQVEHNMRSVSHEKLSPALYPCENQSPVLDPLRHSSANDVTVGSMRTMYALDNDRTHLRSVGVPSDFETTNENILNPVMQAISRGDPRSLRTLLAGNIDPNRIDINGRSPLLFAAERQSEEATELLLQHHADPNICAGPQNISPFAFAISRGMHAIASLHLRHGGDCDKSLPSGDTPFIMAIGKGSSLELIQMLLEDGADINGKTKDGKTPLFEAITIRRIDVVTLLLKHGANPNLAGPKHPLWPSCYHTPILQLMLSYGAKPAFTPGLLELATSINNLEAVKTLIEAGVSPNVKKDGVYTPLCTAIRDDRADMVAYLLASGADPNLEASEYPTFKCITHNRLHYLPQLVAAGADVQRPAGILETAVAHKSSEAVVYLLRHGIDVNARTSEGRTALTTAIRSSQIVMVDKLLANGADPMVRGEDWPLCMAVKTPHILRRILKNIEDPASATRGIMELAVQANQMESVKMLVTAGVNVEDKTGGVFSPLTTAIRENRKDIVRYLLDEAGADINAPGEYLPLVKAIRRNTDSTDTEVIEMLLARGADVNLIYRGWSAVMQAVEKGDLNILRLLVEMGNGIDLQVIDPDSNRLVIDLVKDRGWDEGVRMLLEHRSQTRMITR